MKNKKITSKTKMNEIVSENSDAVEVLFNAGLTCVGCPMAQQETLEEGCMAHGMTKKQIDNLINKLNKNIHS